MFLEHALAELLLAKDYTPMSATRRRQVLEEFIAWANGQGITQVEEVTRAYIRRYIAELRERSNTRYGGHLAGETQHGRASVVRMFLNFCVREEWLDEKVTRHFEMPKKGKKVTPVFTDEHYRRLVRAAEKCPNTSSYLVLRDKALLAVLFDTGIRSMEVCALTLDAVFTAPHESYIRVNGKGRVQREIGIGKRASLALVRYLNRGRPTPVKGAEHFVFLNRSRCQLTPNAIDRLMHRLKQVAGPEHFNGIRVSAHTFRHSFAVHYLQQGGDLYKLSRLLGHESVLTTQRYLSAYSDRDARLTSASVLDQL